MQRTIISGMLVLIAALSVSMGLQAASVDELKERAKRGDVAAQLNLGMMYSRGLGVSEDKTEAMTWLRMAAEKGNAEAKIELDRMLPPVSSASKATGGTVPTGNGTLDIQTTPTDVVFSVFSGNKFVFSGVAPFHVQSLRIGEYNVCFEKQGYDLFWKSVRVDDQTLPVTVSLRTIDPQRAPSSCIDDNKLSQAREVYDAQYEREKAIKEAARKAEELANTECYTDSFPGGASYRVCKDKRTGQIVSRERI